MPPGPRTVRDLIAHARRAGWDHVRYGLDAWTEHVWRSPRWQVSVEVRGDHALLHLHERPAGRPWENRRMVFARVTSAGQAAALLAAYGVIPPPAGCPFCDRWRDLTDQIAADTRELATTGRTMP